MAQTAQPNLQIGALVFPDIDQMDLTGPYEVLSRLDGSSCQLIWKQTTPVRDYRGLVLTPDLAIVDAPQFDGKASQNCVFGLHGRIATRCGWIVAGSTSHNPLDGVRIAGVLRSSANRPTRGGGWQNCYGRRCDRGN